ncbi:phosphotransferase family protein [Oricola sp.]|uniref:phosphotransferase family protein n=1 Tax=Oricola sp. TaxID=1979950 RepID=UPI003BA8EC38
MSTPSTDFDTAALAAYLEANVDGFSALEKVTKFKTGQSNPTYRLQARSGAYVLRAKPAGKLLKSAHMVEREYRVMAALQGTAVPVPRMLHLSGEGDDSPIGRRFFVMEYLDGRIFWDPALPELPDPARRAAIYDQMNEVLAALHDVDIGAAGLTDFGKPGSYFERQLSRWTDQYRASQSGELPDMEALIAWLAEHVPADDGRVSLVHGDYRLDNIMFAPGEDRIIALLDWELSTLGHPFADLAYQCMQWRLPHEGDFRGLGGVDRVTLGIPDEQAYVESYCRRRGISAIPGFGFYLAFSFFRIAAILQGVYKRALDGNASNPQKAKLYGMAVPVVARIAVETLQGEFGE